MKNIQFRKILIFMKVFVRFIFPVVLILSLTAAHAQESGRIAGLVMDKVSGDPLPGANVLLEGTIIGASSDLNGEYLISRVSPGSYNLVVKYIGYKETSIPINVEAGESVYQVIELEYVAIEGEVIEITAQVEGQIEAINQQLASNTIKNVVSADRIQDVPDANAAESVSRLPGISIVRSGGEGQKVTIRGMQPKYNVMMVNGVRMESTDRDDRSTDLNMITPNLLSGIEVTKALTADMDADAVGGTVNLIIGKAKEGFRKNFTLQGGYGSLANTYGNYKINGLLSNRFLDYKLGVQVSGSIDKYDRSSDKLTAKWELNSRSTPEGDLIRTELDNVTISDKATDRKRISGGLVLDYQLSNGSLILNNFISRINENQIEQQNYLNVASYAWSGFAADREYTNTVLSNALQGEFEFFNINMDFSLSNSNTKQRRPGDLRMNIGPVTGGGDLWGDSLDNDRLATPSELLSAYYIIDGDVVKMQRVYTEARDVDEGAQSAVLNFKIPFNITNYLSGNLKFGGKYVRNTREMDESQWRLSLNSSVASQTFIPLLRDSIWTDLGLTPDDGGYVPASLFEDANYDIGNFLSGKEGVSNDAFFNKISIAKMRHLEKLAKETTFFYEADSVYKSYYFYNAQASSQYDYDYTRHFGAFYVMAELKVGKYVTLLPGIRYERYNYIYNADSTSESSGLNVLGYQTFKTKTLHWDSTEAETWFPQMHLRIKPTDWLDIRLASTKSIIYPDYRAVSPYMYFSSAPTTPILETGNPYLKPAITQNYDIYTSVYENHIGLFTAGFFYKEIDNLIRKVTYFTDDASMVQNRIVLDSKTKITTWLNLEETSYVRGFELDWQTHLWYLPSYLKGLVFNINYTKIKSDSRYPYYYTKRIGNPPFYQYISVDTTRSGRLERQPDEILNVTLGYDIGDFSARLSFLYQDNVITKIDALNPEYDTFTAPYYRWDLTAYQKLPWYEGLQLYLNINNITDRPDRDYVSINDKLSSVSYYGRTVDMGIRYQF